jgi:hypothetical protein
MAKLIIISLGGSPDPLKKSITEHRPERLIFFASHESNAKLGEVLHVEGYKPDKIETEITENPNSLYECYKTARRCVDRAARSGVPDSEIMVDYTGGTKVMSAALLLATAGCTYSFNYARESCLRKLNSFLNLSGTWLIVFYSGISFITRKPLIV